MLINRIKNIILINKNWNKFFKYIKNDEQYNDYFKSQSPFINASSINIYDVLDNKGFAKLIKSLKKLKNDYNYQVDLKYRSKLFGTYDYISDNIDSRKTGIVAEIKFINDGWIGLVTITYATLDIYEYLITYKFQLSKNRIITEKLIHKFIVDNSDSLGNYKKFYIATNFLLENKHYREYFDLEKKLFELKLQFVIIELFYTNLGKKYFLPMEYLMINKYINKIVEEFEKQETFCDLYKRDKQILIVNDVTTDRLIVKNICAGKTFPSSIVDNVVLNFGLEMYYKFFYKIEIDIVEKIMRKYYNSKMPFIWIGDIKCLIKKSTFINAYLEKFDIKYNKKIYKHDFRWKHFNYKGWVNDGLVTDKIVSQKFSKLYKDNLLYLQSLSSIQINYLLLTFAILTFVATIISLLIA